MLRSRLKSLLDEVIAEASWLLPALVLIVTVLLFLVVRGAELRIARLDTEQRTQHTIAHLQRHLDSQVQLLHSSAAMLMLDRIVQRQHWQTYLQQLQRLGLPAGMQQLGYAQHIADNDKLALISAMQADGSASFRIFPSRTREAAMPVLYAAPENSNPLIRAGFDLMSDALLAPALQRATDNATATLASVPERAGMAGQFLLVLPVFPGNIVPENIPQRRTTLVGFVFTVVQIDAAFMGLAGEGIADGRATVSLRLFDQPATGRSALLYQNPGTLLTTHRTLRPVNLYGQTWTLETGSPGIPATTSIGVVITGLLLTGWLCWLTRQALQRRGSARRRARAEASDTRQAKLHLAALTALSREAIISIDRRNRITVFNDAARRLFGIGDDNLIGTPLRQLLPHRLKGARPVTPLELQAGQVAVFRLCGQQGQQARRRNGSVFGFEATLFMNGGERQHGYTILLNELPSANTNDTPRDDWQQHLVQEMHDDFGQLLTSMKMDMGLLRAQLAGAPAPPLPATLQHLDRIDGLVSKMMDSVRRILADQSAEQVHNQDFFKALALLVDGHAKRYQIACHLDLPSCPPVIGAALANPLYRIVQEALNNIAKHAAASAITIDVAAPPGYLLLAITDNGCGFVPQQPCGPEAYGLAGMQKRVDALGGVLHIETRLDRGTAIRIRLPLDSSNSS
ncbi:histidine kinase [Oxalobacteraceae bacterium IMCC9480]|nr:histidine kinase [Oxalobacteraceae bacterium IMCC9480]